MERFFGFDLGDAESAVCVLPKEGAKEPQMLTIREAQSFITAYARLLDQELIIGEGACYHPGATERKLRFKSHFLTDRESEADIRCFAAGVLGELYKNGDLVQGEDCCFYVGCPAGWDKNTRERYRRIFEKVGYPPARIISESRAALVSACQSKHLQIGYDILAHPVLVVDIGSSTTDFAYVSKGHEVELRTAGEVSLGGGIMDELLLEEALKRSPREKKIRAIFDKVPPWRSYCEFAARRLKEKYFSDEEYWSRNTCTQNVRINYSLPIRLTLQMDRQIANDILRRPTDRLNGRSFEQVFLQSLEDVKKNIDGDQPELLFLTGGVSKMPAIRDWCLQVFPDSVVISGSDPEFSVCKGLAWCGSIDEELREFVQEIEQLKDSSVVERIVGEHIDDLYRQVVDALIDPILENAVLPVIDRWRNGEIERLQDIDKVLQNEIALWLHTSDARELLLHVVSTWIKPVAYELEEYTVPICTRHKVPYRAMSLSTYLQLSELEIKVVTKEVFAVEEITWMIDAIITLLVGLLCGGSGVALIAGGIPGIIAGSVISLLVLLLGANKMQDMLVRANLPLPMRKLLPRGYFESRLGRISEKIRADFYENLEKEKNEQISERMVADISGQIEECLIKMAKVVEIPLG